MVQISMVSSRKDLKLLCNPSCGAQNMAVLRHILTAAPSSPRCICHRQRSATKPGTRVPSVQIIQSEPKQKDTRRCLFVLAGAEGLEPSARGFGDRCSTN